MRLLCVADLHYRKPWFDWLFAQSTEFDLTCVAGDLLFNPTSFGTSPALPDWDGGRTPALRLQSFHLAAAFSEHLARQTDARYALCSGNHDPLFLWEQSALGGLANDRLLNNGGFWPLPAEGVAISSLPYELRGKAFEQRWEEDHARSRDHKLTWIVLCHVGPTSSPTMLNARQEQPVREMITSHPADFVMHGHVHSAPFSPNGTWHSFLGKTVVLNPGALDFQILSTGRPPCLVIDTHLRQIDWHGLPAETCNQVGSILNLRQPSAKLSW